MKPYLTDFNRFMARQNFKNEKELQAFLETFNGKSLDDLPIMNLTPEEQAEDLVFEAYELPVAKAKKNIEKALELNPNCIEAYEYLASREKKAEKALAFLEKGIVIGREKFGGKFLKENKGVFWGIHETRPFMRCLFQKAEMLVLKEKTAEGAAIMEEILELNERDNQGVRFHLLSALLTLDEIEKFKKYDKLFAEETNSTQMLYPRALFAFKTEGDSTNARKMLKKAFKENPFVVQFLLDDNFNFQVVGSYSPGSPEEANVYVEHGLIPWYKTENAMEWMVKTMEDYLKKLL